MDDYIHLNINFIRALQSNNPDAALYFAKEIGAKYPDNANVKYFHELLLRHSEKMRGRPPKSAAVESDDEDDDDTSSSSSTDDSSEDEEGDDTVAPLEPTRPTAAVPQQKVSIRDYVTLHPSREIDDEVEKMFADADSQIAAAMSQYANHRKP